LAAGVLRSSSISDDLSRRHRGFDEAQAVKEVVAWQLAEAVKKKKISKNKMATLLKTSRTQVDLLLRARDDITLLSLQGAAAMVGRRVTTELVAGKRGLSALREQAQLNPSERQFSAT
jgi:hypothetical protein